MKIIKWLWIMPVILILLGLIGTELNKAYWDRQVEKMCNKDGGVTVFETVTLSLEQYEKNKGSKGGVIIWPKRMAKPHHEFHLEHETNVIKKNNPEIKSFKQIIVRKSDEKELGYLINYSRIGGDFPTGLYPSSFSCLNIVNMSFNLEKKVFLISKDSHQDGK